MKYLITESQLDRAIFLYLNSQGYIQIDKDEIIYFVNSEDYENAPIKYDKGDGSCLIFMDLILDIQTFFSIDWNTSEESIGSWVANTLNKKVSETKVYVKPRWF